MPQFAYKGRNGRGEAVQGALEGPDSSAIADQLFNTGITPIEIKQATGSVGQAAGSFMARFGSPVTTVDLILFSRQMYTLMKSGVPILRALAGLQESATSPEMATIIQDLRQSLDAGRELSAAMRRHDKVFSNFYISLVRVGEMTGQLEAVFLRLQEQLEFDKEMRDRVKSALRYPTFVVIAMAVALIVINIFVIPVFAGVFKSFNTELPLMTRILIGFSNFVRGFWPVLLSCAVAAFFSFRIYVKTPKGRYAWDRLKLRLPIAGKIILKATLARFARSFALSMKSGVPIVQALSVVASVVDNEFIAKRIEQMRDGVERGESVYRTALTAGIFTPIVMQMIAVGDETGELDALMFEIAGMYEREVDYELKTLASQIEPILIVFMAVLVLVLALGVMLPMWSLGQAAFKR